MIKLVEQGRALFALAVEPSQDAESILPALSDLVDHLRLCVGEVIWFRRNVTDPQLARVVVDFAPQRELGRDTFEIQATLEEVRLTGSTPQAVHHAVCHFLEQAFGVRWLWPGPEGTVTPRAADVSWPLGVQRHQPAWAWRRLWLGGAFFQEDDPALAELKYGPVRPDTLRTLGNWQRRQRLEGLKIADGHRWAQICSPLVYGQSHPEYFALVNGQRDTVYLDGKHGNQPCTSNPKVIELTADYVISRFRAQPDLDGFSLSLNDSGRFCECADCQRIDQWADAQEQMPDAAFDRVVEEVPAPQAGEGPGEAGESRGRSRGAGGARGPGVTRTMQKPITDRVFHFANQVAERVAAIYPDKLLLMLVYGPYRQPPRKVALHPNIIAQFCAFTWSHVDEPARCRDLAILDGLEATTTHRGIYDYFVNGKVGSVPRGFARVVEHSFHAYYQRGCRYFATQAGLDFATNGFAYYFAARLLWDMNQTYDQVLDDYCQQGFGPAWEPIRRYLHAYVERWEEVCPVENVADVERLAAELYPSTWRESRHRDLAAAAQLAASRPQVLARIEFLRQGLAFVDHFCRAAVAVNQLADAQAPIDGTAEQLAAWCQQAEASLLQPAADSLRALNHWLNEQADSFVVAAMWMRYQMRHNRMDRVLRVIQPVVDRFQSSAIAH